MLLLTPIIGKGCFQLLATVNPVPNKLIKPYDSDEFHRFNVLHPLATSNTFPHPKGRKENTGARIRRGYYQIFKL